MLFYNRANPLLLSGITFCVIHVNILCGKLLRVPFAYGKWMSLTMLYEQANNEI